jgi:hypothetical protein
MTTPDASGGRAATFGGSRRAYGSVPLESRGISMLRVLMNHEIPRGVIGFACYLEMEEKALQKELNAGHDLAKR